MREHFMGTGGPLAMRVIINSNFTQREHALDKIDPAPEMWQDVEDRAYSVKFLGYVRGYGDYKKLYIVGEQNRVGCQWYLVQEMQEEGKPCE